MAYIDRPPVGRIGSMESPDWSSRRFAILTICITWAIYYLLIALKLATLHVPHLAELEIRHIATALTGALLNLAIYGALVRIDVRPLTIRITTSVILSLVAAILLSAANYAIMFIYDPEALWSPLERARNSIISVSVQTLLEDFFIFAAWSALYTAVTVAIREQIALRHAADMDASARAAQLRALNYQLNPHFLFNALNTISALVIRSEIEPAERAIEALSDFLRLTLSLDPTKTVRLQDEIRLQHDYLQIEQFRYSDRLTVLVDVPSALQSALVPPLLLQPLVENVIKHAVTKSEAPVKLHLQVSELSEKLKIVVQNDGPVQIALGSGVGLRNISERLALLYGAAAEIVCTRLPEGGFKAVVTLPLHH